MHRMAHRATLLAGVLALVLTGVIAAATVASGDPAPPSGIACTQNGSSTFTLTARDGRVETPDGNTIYMWSYADDDGGFQLPGPFLCVDEGDTVTVKLRNTLPEPVSIVFPGQSQVTADGTPVQPQFDGEKLTSLAQTANPGNGVVTYSFVAAEPGTYLYQSGTNVSKQVQMGLYGGLIVRPAMGASFAYNSSDTQFNPASEYPMLLSEIDPDLHHAVEIGKKYNIRRYHPRYWMINGRSFPDTLLPNGSAALPTQPYSSMVHVQPTGPDNPYPALVRYLSVGSRIHPFHPHGNHGRVIARDGRLLVGASGEDTSFEKFLVNVGTNQTWDVTYDWTDVEHWNPTDNEIPVTLPQDQNVAFKGGETWYSGSPYLGVTDELPVGVTSYNQCGEYYQVWHSHALQEAANYEAAFGGMMTLERIDPPGGC